MKKFKTILKRIIFVIFYIPVLILIYLITAIIIIKNIITQGLIWLLNGVPSWKSETEQQRRKLKSELLWSAHTNNKINNTCYEPQVFYPWWFRGTEKLEKYVDPFFKLVE